MAIGRKTGGRKAGTPNKISGEMRLLLKQIISDELEALPATLEQLPGKDRLEAVLKLMPFVLPKIESIEGQYDDERFNW